MAGLQLISQVFFVPRWSVASTYSSVLNSFHSEDPSYCAFLLLSLLFLLSFHFYYLFRFPSFARVAAIPGTMLSYS
jgi:hypothetical protein